MRVRLGRPGAFLGVARDTGCVQQAGVSIRQRVIGLSIVSHGAFVALGDAVETRAVGIAHFLPNPPAVLRPDAEDIAVAIAKKNQLGQNISLKS